MTSKFPSAGLPVRGRKKEAVLAEMEQLRAEDLNWRDGRLFSLVFPTDPEAGALLKEAYNLFFSENGLNPTAFPSLRRFETDVIRMSAALLGGDQTVVGNMTSGGTESILMSVLTAREWARAERPQILTPEIILPRTGHPAFEKAAHYFDCRIVQVPVGADFRVDMTAVRRAITTNTVLLVGSAPSYPQGVIDPIPELAALAQEYDLLCHVDACVGGFFLPFLRQIGHDLPDFDFSVPGVTSLSADLHKYGYAAKGASLILYRNKQLRRYQLYATTDWPGGIYASPTMAGTRPGGAIAAAWAIMHYFGQEGYQNQARQIMSAVAQVREGIAEIPELQILGAPQMSIMALGSDTVDIYEVGDELTARGWHLDRQQFPPSLHMTINYAHIEGMTRFLRDLRTAVDAAKKRNFSRLWRGWSVRMARGLMKRLPAQWASRLTRAAGQAGGSGLPARSAAMYGMMGTLPNRGDIKEVVLDLVEQFTEPQAAEDNAKSGE
jgi:sphinganine-1-phosphate aldolase